MTAEIGILNRHGVALAADSAVTITQGGKLKVLNTANKLFNLSKYEPVGIMIYGNGSYINTPWDIIIKEYRRKLGEDKFDSLKEYADDFFEFLFTYEKVNTIGVQRQLAGRMFCERLDEILSQVNHELYSRYEGSKPPEEEVKVVLEDYIKNYINHIEGFNDLYAETLITFEEYRMEFYEILRGIISESVYFELDQSSIEDLIKVGYYSLTKDNFINYTGIVIAGYGDKDIFPTIYEYYVNGVVKDFRRYKLNRNGRVDAEQSNTATIMPFAQQEMVHSVVSGIDPYLYNEIQEVLSSVTLNIGELVKTIIETYNLDIDYSKYEAVFIEAGKEIKKESINVIEKVRQEKFITPILNMVEMLHKDELATMAENLVNLTSFKRRITIDEETVGGPVDVAVISKTDGFIWIKRKHYFNPDINYNYFNKVKERCEFVSK